MRGSQLAAAVLSLVLLAVPVCCTEHAKEPELKPCTAHSPINGQFYDLNAITVRPLQNHKKAHKDDRTESWKARGYDYNTNFTINFCAPVIEQDLGEVVGIKNSLVKNISAYYTMDGKTYSIGHNNAEPIFRGRKLVMNYTDGSPCDDGGKRNSARKLNDHKNKTGGNKDDKEDDDDDDDKPAHTPSHTSPSAIRRKSSMISFICDRDSLTPAHVSFIGASPDECTYFFEARSAAACGGAIAPTQTVNAGGVFAVISIIAIAVYLLGGIAYQRTVMHQRGWKQLPNYALWASIFSFISDFAQILCGSCMRFLPKRRGYNQLSQNGGMRGRGRAAEENGLIDSLEEEWDD